MKVTIGYKPQFLRNFKKLPPELQQDARNKIELFRESDNHEQLRVHKLKGKLKNCYSFSISYSHRVVFEYETKNEVVFLNVGSHDIYK